MVCTSGEEMDQAEIWTVLQGGREDGKSDEDCSRMKDL